LIIREDEMAYEVKVYSTPTCPHCMKTKQFLDEKQVAFQNIDVTKDRAALDEMVNKTGQLAVPVIEIDGQIKVGFNQAWLEEKLGIAGQK